MKSRDIVGIIIGILVLLGVTAISLISTVTDGEPVVEREVIVRKQVNIPAIDASRPAETVTAQFALG